MKETSQGKRKRENSTAEEVKPDEESGGISVGVVSDAKGVEDDNHLKKIVSASQRTASGGCLQSYEKFCLGSNL